MKIGIDARLWNETGVGRYIRNLIAELAKIDKENQYFLFLRQKEFGSFKLPGKNWEKRLADIHWHGVKEQLMLPKILGHEKLDLVHFPYFNVPIFYRRPFVVTIHDLIINHFPTGKATTLPGPVYQLKRLGYKTALSHAVKNSKKIIAVSEATKSELIDHFGVNPDKIVVTYESGELEAGRYKAASVKHEALMGKYLLYVGNAHPHKNLERLFEALSSTKHKGLDKKLILVGKEDYFYRRLKKRAEEMGLGEKVVFYGEANDSQLQQLYKNASALILPSFMEGFGLPALEAMGQGCLVLASDIPAFREICADAAVYFDPLNVEEMAKKIEDVYLKYSKKWDELKKNGLSRSKMFSWSKMAMGTLEVYRGS